MTYYLLEYFNILTTKILGFITFIIKLFLFIFTGSAGVDGEPGRDGPKGQRGTNYLFGAILITW